MSNVFKTLADTLTHGLSGLNEGIGRGAFDTSSVLTLDTVGEEIEWGSVCTTSGRLVPLAARLVRTGNFPQSVLEVHEAMGETNGFGPWRVEPGLLQVLAARERVNLEPLCGALAKYGAGLFFGGVCPGATLDQFTGGWYVGDKPRYWQLIEGLQRVHGDDGIREVRVPDSRVPSRAPYSFKTTFSAAGMVYSRQYQYRLHPRQVGKVVNVLHLLAGPLIGLFANATSIGGVLLDSASARPQIWRCLTAAKPGMRAKYNRLLTEWLPENDSSAFGHWVQQLMGPDPVVTCVESPSDSADEILARYLSSWPWIRPKWGKDNLRCEVRFADEPRTPEEAQALFALLTGCLLYALQTDLRVSDYLTPAEARANFFNGATYGLLPHDEAGFSQDGAAFGLHWRGRPTPIRQITLECLLPWAQKGLTSAGFSHSEIDASLAPVLAVAKGAHGGAEWIRARTNRLRRTEGLSAPEAGAQVTREMLELTWGPKRRATEDWPVV